MTFTYIKGHVLVILELTAIGKKDLLKMSENMIILMPFSLSILEQKKNVKGWIEEGKSSKTRRKATINFDKNRYA